MTRSTRTAKQNSQTIASSVDEHPFRYSAALANQIEPKWHAQWERTGAFGTPNPGDPNFDAARAKFYCLDMFPYPSGAGLHVGHPEGYTATDIICRYKRHKGFNVLHPMGWDAFGLPAEQYAIQTGVHPAVTTRRAIDTFRGQLKRFGFSYDWSREFATIDPDYYKWTQWIWLKAYNAWYDAARNRARPIEDLIADLDSDKAACGVAPSQWRKMPAQERRAFIDDQRLAYLAEQTVNWCPKLGTALANEEVIDGKSERGGFPVYRKPLRQWMFRITAYAERLLNDLDMVKWPESTRIQQAEWIGRSEGAEIDFIVQFDVPLARVESAPLRVFTTRPDTVFGATFMVIAPEHPLVAGIVDNPPPQTDAKKLRDYVEAAKNRSDIDRMAETKDKTGVFTGVDAINPATKKRIPIWVADYVLMGYGHGAIMAVPAHDARDHAFARKFDLPITEVVVAHADGSPSIDCRDEAYEGPGFNKRSSNADVSLDGLPTAQAKTRIIDWLEKTGMGRRKINYKLRDWLFSRQRYWGEPFPVVFDSNRNHYPIDESHLPVKLPEMQDYQPIESDEPMPLLAKATDWVNTTAGAAGVSPSLLPSGAPVKRETNTMPGWAGSCWYYLRFCDPRNDSRFVSRDVERYWMVSSKAGRHEPAGLQSGGFDAQKHHAGCVDLYIGGAEHAVLHLLYARFWHKILFDLGEVSTPEPFGRLFHQGMITSFAYQRPDRSLVPVDQVEERSEGKFFEIATNQPVVQIIAKMSKSLKNVINPDDVIASYGADTFRLYEMYMGPLEQSKPWNPRDIEGPFRFLQRAWRLVVDERTGALRLAASPTDTIEKQLHRTIAKVETDIERLSLNTAIAAMIEFVNQATKVSGELGTGILTRQQLQRFAIMLSPFAPHMAEELWSKLGHSSSIAYEPWPAVEQAMLRDDQIELPVQIMGKVRGKITVPADADEQTVQNAALSDSKIAQLIEGKTVRKVVVVPGKIVNIVAN
jgi:leucyl-tRNA synthetase